MMERTSDGEHHYYEHGHDHSPRGEGLTATWTERATAWLELPDGSFHEFDIDPRPRVGFASERQR